MIRITRILSLILTVFAVFPLQAQLIDDADYDSTQVAYSTRSFDGNGSFTYYGQFADYYEATPEATAITQYTPPPVSLYTGTPSISIPIYTIESGDYQLPIFLSYQATGIKVAQESSRVGLGWSLQAGGLISRVIQGNDDLVYARPKRNINGSGGTIEYDADEPDIFYYAFGGYSGRFYLKNFPHEPTQYEVLHGIVDPHGNEYVFFISKPEDNLQISYDSISSTFIVTTQDGTKYIFSEIEKYQKRIVVGRYDGNVEWKDGEEYAGDAITMASQRETDYIPEFAENTAVNSSWYLRRIDCVNGDTIGFRYDILNDSYISPVKRTQVKTLYISTKDEVLYGSNLTRPIETQTIERSVRQPVLREIEWKNGRVLFESGPEARQDIRKQNASASDSHPLAAIKVVSTRGDTVRSFRLHHSYFNGKPAFTSNGEQNIPYLCKRLRLDSISVCGSAQKRMSHSFGYDMSDSLPAKNMLYTDRWGYYTGVNRNVIPYDIADLKRDVHGWEVERVLNKGYANLNTYPQPSSKASVWSLISHRQPTGALTTFEYEPHEGISDKKYASDTLVYNLTKTFFETYRDTAIVLPKTCNGVIQISATYESFRLLNSFPMNGYIPVAPEEGDSISIEDYYRRQEKNTQLFFVSGANISKGFPYGTEYSNENNHAWFRYSLTKHLSNTDTLHLRLASSETARIYLTVTIINTSNVPIAVGGIRVRRIQEPTGDTYYTYRDGLLLRDPVSTVRTHMSSLNCDMVELHSAPSQPMLNPFTGQYIGYGTVETERVSGNNHFRNLYTFNAEKESMPYIYSKGSISPLNGMCIADSSFINDALISSGSYDYMSKQKGIITSISKENDRKAIYTVSSHFTPSTMAAKTLYDSSGAVQHCELNKSKYFADEIFPYNLTQITDSADSIMKNIIYTNTVSFAPDWARTDGRILPVEETLYMRGEPYKRIVRRYSADSLALPLEEYVFYKTPDSPWPQTLGYLLPTELPREEWTYTPDVRYTSYDSKGRLTSFETRMGQSTVQLWGYNHQYLIAEIKNARLQDVTSCGVDIEAIAGKSEPSSADWTLLKSLRTLLPQSLVTIYQYKPLVGVTSMFSPNGTETRYTYDEFNRLQTESIVEGTNNVIHKYEYKYATENQ